MKVSDNICSQCGAENIWEHFAFPDNNVIHRYECACGKYVVISETEEGGEQE